MAFVDLWDNKEEKMSCILAKDLGSFRATHQHFIPLEASISQNFCTKKRD